MNTLLEKFQQQLLPHHWQGKKLVVAVSGGLDSMALAYLLLSSSADFVLAHCNFHLRGKESDGDEKLVEDWAKQHEIRLYVRHFETLEILKNEGGNLEETARQLRYQWFEELRQELNFDFIATAHHQQDSIETALINFFKGTGISGLHGILPQQGRIIRPLLSFQKEALRQFAMAEQIPWREDSSNAGNDYLRNRIRHELWPAILNIFPQAETALSGNLQRFREVEMIYDKAMQHYRKKLLEHRGRDWYVPILKLRHVEPLQTVLFECLRPFGLHAAQLAQVIYLLDAEAGKFVLTEQYRILKDRNFLIISSREPAKSDLIRLDKIDKKETIAFAGGTLTLEAISPTKADVERLLKRRKVGREIMALSSEDFPLYLRPARDGDYFYPLGMGRKKKKVGRFLRDEKVPLHEKERVYVLESCKRIVWVLGYRIDERFKVNANTTFVLSADFKEAFPLKKD